MRNLVLLIGFILIAATPGCGPRGTLALLPEGSPPTQEKAVLVATSRASAPPPEFFGSGRSYKTNYARFEISIPPNRQPGEIKYPDNDRIDPDEQFLVSSFSRIGTRQDFARAINSELAKQPAGMSQGTIFVHGFNTNFPEGVMRDVALMLDTGRPGVNVVYSWPSAGSVLKYLDDRESVLFARDSVKETFETMSESRLSNYLVVAHSMGTFVVMDALRELALERNSRTLRKMKAVVLISADLDIDVFLKQAPAVLAAGVPIVLLTTQDDLALRTSATMRGQDDRVGDLRDNSRLGGLDIPVFDLSNVKSGGALKHFKIGSSPEILDFLKKLNQSGQGVIGTTLVGPVINIGEEVLEDATDVLLTE
ncbi:MAG: alpha/beta hydrolase [Roseobacter sp.]